MKTLSKKWIDKTGNFVFDVKGGYISYNPCVGVNNMSLSTLFDSVASLDGIEAGTGKEETAIYIEETGNFAILNGNFTKEYEKCKTVEEALKIYNKNKGEHNSSWTTYEN